MTYFFRSVMKRFSYIISVIMNTSVAIIANICVSVLSQFENLYCLEFPCIHKVQVLLYVHLFTLKSLKSNKKHSKKHWVRMKAKSSLTIDG